MISLSASGGSITFTFSGNSGYLQDGVITVPVNSLTLVTDNSEMATFRKSASNDIFISALYSDFGMTKEQLVSFYKNNMVGSTGGGGGGTVDPTLDSGSTNPVANSAITQAVQSTICGDIVYETTGGYSGGSFWGGFSADSYENAATVVSGQVFQSGWKNCPSARFKVIDEQGNESDFLTRIINDSDGTNYSNPSSASTVSTFTQDSSSGTRIATLTPAEGYRISYCVFYWSYDNDPGYLPQNDNTYVGMPYPLYYVKNGCVTKTAMELATEINNSLSGYQKTLLAGTGIEISSSNVISSPVDTYLNSGSTNPVQNSIVTNALKDKVNTWEFNNAVISSTSATYESEYGNTAKTGYSASTYYDGSNRIAVVNNLASDELTADFIKVKCVDEGGFNTREFEFYKVGNEADFTFSSSTDANYVNAGVEYGDYVITPKIYNGQNIRFTEVFVYKKTRATTSDEWEPASGSFTFLLIFDKKVLEIINYILGQLNQ